jgi:predicted N-formylglutamate amidohydrolase
LTAVPRIKAAAADWPDPVEILNPHSSSPLVLICEHASNHVPGSYERLGVTPADLERHIAYDIGAANVTRGLAARLQAPAFLGTYSRLLVDLNRPFGAPTSMPTRSETTEIPRNRHLDEAEMALRRQRVFEPFHRAIETFLDNRASRPSFILAVHSFTPIFHGQSRPWHAGVLHENLPALARRLMGGLAEDGSLIVGENVPYTIGRDSDYAIPIHGTDRSIPALLLEMRNDLIVDAAGVAAWVDRLTPLLHAIIATAR